MLTSKIISPAGVGDQIVETDVCATGISSGISSEHYDQVTEPVTITFNP